MIRMRTKVGNGRVFTLYFMGKWVTLINDGQRASSTDSDNLLDAGINHLNACNKLKEIMDERGRTTAKLFHGEGHQGNLHRGVSGSSDGSHRTGLDGDDGSERDQNLQTNSSASQDQNACELGPEDAELSHGEERV